MYNELAPFSHDCYVNCLDDEKKHIPILENIAIVNDCDAMTTKAFCELCNDNSITRYDGQGYFHNGTKETNISVWNDDLTPEDIKDYPYICWYNK